MQNIRFKLVTANDIELFDSRLASFVDSLDSGDLIVDVKFATTALPTGEVEFSALVHYQGTETWH